MLVLLKVDKFRAGKAYVPVARRAEDAPEKEPLMRVKVLGEVMLDAPLPRLSGKE